MLITFNEIGHAQAVHGEPADVQQHIVDSSRSHSRTRRERPKWDDYIDSAPLLKMWTFFVCPFVLIVCLVLV